MTAQTLLREAIRDGLRGDATLAALVNQISDGEPVKASPPWLRIDDGTASAWGARGVDGVSLRQPMQLLLRGDSLAPVAAILDRIDAVMLALASEYGDWRVTALTLERSQVARVRNEWRATMIYTLRLARLV